MIRTPVAGENMEFAGTGSEGKSETINDECQPQEDRRAADRVVCTRPHSARIMVRPSLLSYQARVHNFTRTGVGLSVQHCFEPGTVLAIQLRIANTGLSCVLAATVVRCQLEAPGQWFLGCKLSRSLTDEETRSLF
jgi:hypothetical protein